MQPFRLIASPPPHHVDDNGGRVYLAREQITFVISRWQERQQRLPSGGFTFSLNLSDETREVRYLMGPTGYPHARTTQIFNECNASVDLCYVHNGVFHEYSFPFKILDPPYIQPVDAVRIVTVPRVNAIAAGTSLTLSLEMTDVLPGVSHPSSLMPKWYLVERPRDRSNQERARVQSGPRNQWQWTDVTFETVGKTHIVCIVRYQGRRYQLELPIDVMLMSEVLGDLYSTPTAYSNTLRAEISRLERLQQIYLSLERIGSQYESQISDEEQSAYEARKRTLVECHNRLTLLRQRTTPSENERGQRVPFEVLFFFIQIMKRI